MNNRYYDFFISEHKKLYEKIHTYLIESGLLSKHVNTDYKMSKISDCFKCQHEINVEKNEGMSSIKILATARVIEVYFTINDCEVKLKWSHRSDNLSNFENFEDFIKVGYILIKKIKKITINKEDSFIESWILLSSKRLICNKKVNIRKTYEKKANDFDFTYSIDLEKNLFKGEKTYNYDLNNIVNSEISFAKRIYDLGIYEKELVDYLFLGKTVCKETIELLKLTYDIDFNVYLMNMNDKILNLSDIVINKEGLQ